MKPRKPTYRELESTILELQKENGKLRAARPLPKSVIRHPEQFRVLAESLNDALVVSNEKGEFTYVNGALCELLGYKAEEMIGRPAIDFLDEGSKAGFRKEMEKRRMGRASRYKKTLVAKDGRRVVTVVTGTPIIDEYGRFKGAFGVIKDTAEHGSLLEELEDKTRRIKEAETALGV